MATLILPKISVLMMINLVRARKMAVERANINMPQLSMAIRITKAPEGSVNILTASRISWLTPMPGQRINIIIAMASRHRVLRKCLMVFVQSIVILISHLVRPGETVIS